MTEVLLQTQLYMMHKATSDRIIDDQCGSVAKTEDWTVQYQENSGKLVG